MSGPGDGDVTNEESSSARSREEIEADLAQTRDHLADTVDALGRKLDVKSRSAAKAAALKQDHGTELAVGGAVLAVAVVVFFVWKARRR